MNQHDQNNTDVINPNERIYKITETCDGETRSFYAIQDIEFGHWRGTSDPDDHDAWTRSTFRRAEFATRREAREELKFLWGWRRAKNGVRAFRDFIRKGRAA